MPSRSQTFAQIDDVFADWNTMESPGVAVGIVRDDEPFYTQAFGLANVEHNVPITPSTVFDIGSMTKQFTAFATLMLIRDGQLGLDDDVRRYITGLPRYETPVRIRHCLYHTTGLSDWVAALELTGPACDYLPAKLVFQTIAALDDTMFPAGEMHSYSNTGYVLLARIIQEVTGKPLPVFLKDRVFDPLGMSSAAFRSDPFGFFPNQAQGYVRGDDGRLFRMTGASDVWGDGGMQASIDDMTRWLINISTHQVGDAVLFDQVFAPGRLDDGQELRYAAGWMLQPYRGHRSFQHGGLMGGFQSFNIWLPDLKIGVAILGNVRPYIPWRLATGAIDVLLGEHPLAARPLASGPARQRTGYADDAGPTGRYFTATGLPVVVTGSGDRLTIDIWLWGRRFDRLACDVFREEHSGDTVTFHRNSDGTVTGFAMQTDDGACLHMHSPIEAAVKYETITLDNTMLTCFEGRYVNEAIETAYQITAEDGALTARHRRCHDWLLHPIKANISTAFEDDFAQDDTWPGIVTFKRGSDGQITGFRVRGTGVNLFFRKQTPTGA